MKQSVFSPFIRGEFQVTCCYYVATFLVGLPLYKHLHLLLSFPARQISLSPKACLAESCFMHQSKKNKCEDSVAAAKNLISYDLQVEAEKGPFERPTLSMQGQNLN